MPTARHFPSVLSLESTLVVAGGDIPFLIYTNTVEIFKADTSQWYRTDLHPTDCMDISMVTTDNMCYVLGGYVHSAHLNQVLYASMDSLFHNSMPLKQAMSSNSNRTSVWKVLPSTPTYRSTAADLAGNLFAIGGKEFSKKAYHLLTRRKYMFTLPPQILGSMCCLIPNCYCSFIVNRDPSDWRSH